MNELSTTTSVGGRQVLRTLGELENAAIRCIEFEQEKIAPDNALIGVLCDTVRLIREHLDHVNGSGSGWISEPKEPGWYWFRGILYGEERTEPVHVFVRPGHQYLCIWDPAASAYGKSNYFHVGRLGAKWYGPITAPAPDGGKNG